MNDAGMTRQSFLRRAVFALAGAIGGSAALSSTSAHAAEPITHALDSGVQLAGREWHLFAQNRLRGEPPQQGDQVAVYGELYRTDAKVGEFYSSGLQLGAPLGISDLAAGAMEVHTFNLTDGTILGMGSSSAIIGAESVFAIVGGTGRYAGATGSYTARQDPHELGGSGTADFVFQLKLAV
jgi:hypothetical protein